jgi:hypothetical protein
MDPDRQRIVQEQYRNRYREDSAATAHDHTTSESHAVEFAKVTIQSLLLISGGALVTLPTVLDAVG